MKCWKLTGSEIMALLWGGGMFFIVCTGWRLPFLPVGLGELFLLVVAGMSFLKTHRIGWVEWILSGVAGLLSLTLALQFLKGQVVYDAGRSWVAYMYCIAVGIPFWQFARSNSVQALKGVVCAGVFSVILLYVSLLSVSWGGWPWLGSSAIHFIGYSQNPAQLSVYLVPLPFFMARLLGKERVPILIAVGMVLSFFWVYWSGLMSVVLAGVAGAVYMTILALILRKKIIGVLGFGLVLLLVYLFAVNTVPEKMNSSLVRCSTYFGVNIRPVDGQLMDVNESAAFRLALWRNGLKAGMRSPLIGLGPGAASGYDKPFGGMEAHNSIIDLFMAAGLLGVAAAGSWVAVLAFRLVKRKEIWLSGALAALLVNSCFFLTLRSPSFWMGLILCSAFAFTEEQNQTGERRT